MHAAPSVSYPVGRSAFAGGLAAALALLGLAAAAGWALQSQALGWRQGLAFAAVLLSSAFALGAWLRAPQGVLRWDGEAWQWEQGGRGMAGGVAVALDLQSRLLVRWRGETGATRRGREKTSVRWLWLERKSDASHWDALRRAVYSRARAPIPTFPRRGKERPPADPPPAAEQ